MLRKFFTLFLLALPAAALLIAAGCTHTSSPAVSQAPPPAAVQAVVANDYVGSEACGKCHVAEWQSHRNTHHAHTFRPMTVADLGKLAPPQTLFSDTSCAVAITDGKYVLVNPQTGQSRPLHYALGSGKQGLTFIQVVDDDSILEMRKSYIPRTHAWYATPGQEGLKTRDVGVHWLRTITRKCVLCHSVTLSDYRCYPDPKFMGVGCESCHGPGGAHIAAVQSGNADIKMVSQRAIGGKRINALCGVCHRSTEEVGALPTRERLPQRFMVYGLEKSRCFRESGDRLSCVTCHNPHDDASLDHKSYERVCLNCHTRNSGTTAGASTTVAPGSTALLPISAARTTCPVNPRNGCIDCHMPTRSLSGKLNKIPIAMADHWIRVNKP